MGVSSYFISSTKSWKQFHEAMGTEADGAHSTWFCSRPREATAEETLPALTKVDKKPKERVKTEHKDDINLEAAGSVAQFKVKRHFYTTQWKLVVNTRLLSGRHTRF